MSLSILKYYSIFTFIYDTMESSEEIMMKEYLNTLYKRKSIRKYDRNQHLSEAQIADCKVHFSHLIPLVPDINYHLEIVKREETTAKFGEYCLLFYSEEKPFALLNAGYILEQIDLYLETQNIGVCWYGMAHTKYKTYQDMKFIIMLAFGSSYPLAFRQNITEFKRKPVDEIWSGDFNEEVKNIVRLAPSACNTQSWRFVCSADQITVYRNPNVRSIIPKSKLCYFNSIDLGIVLCFLDIALESKDYSFTRTLIDQKSEEDFITIAKYQIKK